MIQHPKTPGRNDPCWCGSGKKYKHCHQRADEERVSEKLQNAALWRALGEFALQRKYKVDFQTAAKFFFGTDEAPNPEGGAEEQADFERALDYFLFDYQLPDNSRVIEHFVTERGRLLSPRQRAWLTNWSKSAPALLEILSIERGVGVHARDLLTNEIYDIRDKTGSETTARWAIAFVRVLYTDDHYELGSSGLNVPPRFRGMLLAYVQELRDAYAQRYPDATIDEFLRTHAHLINQYILDELTGAMQQLPIMLTPERDLMEHAVATYDVPDHAHALARLRASVEFKEMNTETLDARTFGWHETGESLAQLRLHGAPFEWQTPVGDPNGVRALGTVNLSLDTLSLDVVSRRRLKAGKALLEKHLGDAIRFREEQIQSFAETLAFIEDAEDFQEDEFEDADAFQDFDESDDDFEADADFDDDDEADSEFSSFEPTLPDFSAPPAELQEQIARYRANHNQAWIDQKIPLLDNQTPRQAVHSFGGRLQVIRLLKDFEAREAENQRRGENAFDWGTVATELGLSEQEFRNEGHIEDTAHELLSLITELTFLHQTDVAWNAWKKFRELIPIERVQDLWFAEVWDLEEMLTDLVMELESLLAREKRFDEARALLDDYIALDADTRDWALAQRQALEIERAIYSDPVAVQAAVAALEKLAQAEDTAFQALMVLAELQEGLLGLPDAAEETLRRAERAAGDDGEEQFVYDTLMAHFDAFRKCAEGELYWHEQNAKLNDDEREYAGLARLLIACSKLDEASAVAEKIEPEETRNYFAGILAVRRGNVDEARKIWQAKLAECLEQLEWRWFEWAEMSLYLRDGAAVLEKIDPAAHENHPWMHWFRALAYAQQNDFENATRAADAAREAIRAQSRRMGYDSSRRRKRALANALALSDAALRALNLEAPIE